MIHDGFTPHAFKHSPQSHSFVAKEAKFLRRLSLTCLKISWSAWRFGKELVILHKWIATKTSVSPIECSHPVRFIRCPAQPAPRLYFADCDIGKMFVTVPRMKTESLTEFMERS